jgi:hypothetical protein
MEKAKNQKSRFSRPTGSAMPSAGLAAPFPTKLSFENGKSTKSKKQAL